MRGDKDTNEVSDALLTWAPSALMASILKHRGDKTTWHKGTEEAKPQQDAGTEHPDYGDAMGLDSLPGTRLQGNEYGEETRVNDGVDAPHPGPKFIGHRIGPDLGWVEGFSSTVGSMKAGLAKRVQPLEFKPTRQMLKDTKGLSDEFLAKIFTREKIWNWCINNPTLQGGKSWSAERFRMAFHEALAESEPSIQHGFQIKSNEILPSKNKAPRPLITSGDRGIVMMSLVVTCMEDILFEVFHDASIKHRPKEDAMKDTVKRLRQRGDCDTQ